jgi:tight adherence protein B
MLLWLIIIGGFGTLFLAFMAFQGPSASKTVKRRIELI